MPLLNRYDVYQRLMDYWDETMSDDAYLVVADGWIEATQPVDIIDDKQRKIRETPDLTVQRKKYKMDLIPPVLIIARYFSAEQAEIELLRASQKAAARDLEEFMEDQSGEGGTLESAVNSTGKIDNSSIRSMLKSIKNTSDSVEERRVLTRCLHLIKVEFAARKAVSEARIELDRKVLLRYASLTEDEIKRLVVEDKWFAAIRIAIEGEILQLTQYLAERVKELEQRYGQPLAKLEGDAYGLAAKVEIHLKSMGVFK